MGKGYLVKRLEIKAGGQITRCNITIIVPEHWIVVEGVATVTRGEETFDLEANASTYIAKGMMHRLENRQDVPLLLIEVQTGDIINEEDIVRLEDKYGSSLRQ